LDLAGFQDDSRLMMLRGFAELSFLEEEEKKTLGVIA